MKTIGILIFEDVEELDFVGPLEVFGMAARQGADCRIVTVAQVKAPVRCGYGLIVEPHVAFAECGPLDILVVPGGRGAQVARTNTQALDFIRQQPGVVVSVCTGALILAAAGLLDGCTATTHHGALDMLKEYSRIDINGGERFILHERIGTSAGVTAGIDVALALVARFWGIELARSTAAQIEWPFREPAEGA